MLLKRQCPVNGIGAALIHREAVHEAHVGNVEHGSQRPVHGGLQRAERTGAVEREVQHHAQRQPEPGSRQQADRPAIPEQDEIAAGLLTIGHLETRQVNLRDDEAGNHKEEINAHRPAEVLVERHHLGRVPEHQIILDVMDDDEKDGNPAQKLQVFHFLLHRHAALSTCGFLLYHAGAVPDRGAIMTGHDR